MTADLRERPQQGLAGQYRLERGLGQGGMATVYLARRARPMSLVKCRDCGQGVSETAEVCPACGAKHPALVPWPWKLRIGVALLLLLVIYYLIQRQPS